jgi:hypothetical protein
MLGSGCSVGFTSCCSSSCGSGFLELHLLLFLSSRSSGSSVGPTSCCSSSRGSSSRSHLLLFLEPRFGSSFGTLAVPRAAVPVPQSVPPLAVPRAAVPVPHSVSPLAFLEPRFRFLIRSHLLLFLDPVPVPHSVSPLAVPRAAVPVPHRYHLLLFLEPRFGSSLGFTRSCSHCTRSCSSRCRSCSSILLIDVFERII